MKKKRGIVIIGPEGIGKKRSIPEFIKDKKEIEEIAKKEKLKIVIVDPSEKKMKPTNFLNLPDGKILFNKAPKTIAKLKKAGVKEEDLIINKRKVEFNPEYGGGSIRYFTLSTK